MKFTDTPGHPVTPQDIAAMAGAKYEQAIHQLAQWLDIDPQAVLRGQAMELSGVTFSLQHYGEADPGGVTLVVDYGEISAPGEEYILRQMLEYNLRAPPGAHGYFGVSPGQNRMLYCMRLDFDAAPDPAEAIGHLVASVVEALVKAGDSMSRQADVMLGNKAAQENRLHG